MLSDIDSGFRLRYRALLVLLVMIATTSHTLTILQVEANQFSAKIINDAGKQRMFTQRIASLVLQFNAGHPNARTSLEKTVTQFKQHHAALNKTIEYRNHLVIYRAIDIQYARVVSATIASNAIEQFLAAAETILSAEPARPAYHEALGFIVTQANEPILNAIEKMAFDEQKIAETQIARVQKIQKISLISILATTLIGLFAVFNPMAKNASYLRRLASIDALTGTLNRRAFLQRTNDELLRAKRYLKPMSLLAIDVDHFKQINDRYGHSGGDAALVSFATTIQQQLRSSDALGRWGGEEFLIVLAETNTHEAAVVAERYRHLLADLSVIYGTETIKMTVSIGVASLALDDATVSSEQLIEHADQALYTAKRNGRNQVVVYHHA